MIPSAPLPTAPTPAGPVDVPSSPTPPGEGRITSNEILHRESAPVAAYDGRTGIGAPQPAPSSVESRPARLRRHDYVHDQTGGQQLVNGGDRVAVGRHPGWPRGEHEAGAGQPQRPTFRTPPETWTAGIEV